MLEDMSEDMFTL